MEVRLIWQHMEYRVSAPWMRFPPQIKVRGLNKSNIHCLELAGAL